MTTERNYRVTGLDVSFEMIRLATNNHPNELFIKQDVCSWDSSIGTNENLRLLMENGPTIRHLEQDQYPEKHVCVTARKS